MRIEHEYYFDSSKATRSKADSELADDLKKFFSYIPVRELYVDPAAASLKIELRNRNVPVIDAKNDVLPGIKTVGKFVHGKNLVISRNCPTLIEQMQTYSWDPKAADRGIDEPLKKDDHACDALRYLCYSHFPDGEIKGSMLDIDAIHRDFIGQNYHSFTPAAMQTGGYY